MSAQRDGDQIRPLIEPGPRTTVFRGPLAPDGTIDYATALNKRDAVPPEENALVTLLPLTKRWEVDPNDPHDQLWIDLLGVKQIPQRIDVGELLTPIKAIENDNQQVWDLYGRLQDAPWKSADYPVIADWLRKREPVFALLSTASRKKSFWSPAIYQKAYLNQNPKMSLTRSLTRLAVAELQRRWGDGQFDEAISLWSDAMRLTAIEGRDQTLISLLTAQSEQALLFDVIHSWLGDPSLTADRLTRIDECLKATRLPMPDGALDESERIGLLDTIQRFHASPAKALESMSPWGEFEPGQELGLRLGIDGDYAMRCTNDMMDHAVFGARLRTRQTADAWFTMLEYETPPVNMQAIKNFINALMDKPLQARPEHDPIRNARLFLQAASSRKYRSLVLVQSMDGLLTSAFGAAVESAWRQRASRALIETAVAVERFQREHERYPERVQDLVPAFLAEVPLDPLSDVPLHYRVNEAGDGFLLYSVGSNGTDEDGLDDWSEGDMVWQVPRRVED